MPCAGLKFCKMRDIFIININSIIVLSSFNCLFLSSGLCIPHCIQITFFEFVFFLNLLLILKNDINFYFNEFLLSKKLQNLLGGGQLFSKVWKRSLFTKRSWSLKFHYKTVRLFIFLLKIIGCALSK